MSQTRKSGRRLRKERELLGLTLEELAAKVGVSWMTIYRAEKGNCWPVHRIFRERYEAVLQGKGKP